ncbi:unnamed protein product [Symbiodinium sp. CCMP2592]|nr:unnamed protein product [Symbiodinium sp. CCMP2592]
MALCYRRTFIDEESPAAAVRRARSAPPAGETPVDAETVQVNKDLAELSIRAQELLPKHSCASTLETSQDEVSTVPSGGWSREQSEEELSSASVLESGAFSPPGSCQESTHTMVIASGASSPSGSGQDGTSPSAEIAEILANREEPAAAVAGENPGSYGHPEVCRKPCIFFQAGQCENGARCGYCHCQHVKRQILPDRRQRALLRRLNATGMLTFFIPPLEKRAEEAGIQDKAAGVLDRLQEALNQSSRSPTTLAADDAEYLQHLLDKMTFGNLMAMLLHNLGSSEWADATREMHESLRLAVRHN